jgi:cob(I)alamin adenosyltransferase
MGEGYTWNTQDRERDVAKAQAAWALAREMLADESLGLLVFDEINIALKYRYLDVQQVIADLHKRPPMQHVVLTGRAAPPELIEVAHTVTEMGLVKHAFKQGFRAQRGIEL